MKDGTTKQLTVCTQVLANMSSSNIKICVRIRPEQGTEKSSKFREVVKAIGDKIVVFDPPDDNSNGLKQIFTSQRNKDLKFSFDHVFGPESSQLDVYRCTTATILDDVLNGFNCCVFAYGATGAGKTFTMLGNKENPGVIYKTVMMLYTKIDALSDEYKYDVDVSYVEIYNENLKDLLSPGRKLVMNEGSDGKMALRGVSMHQPKNADELLDMLLRGNTERTQSSTSANSESSRSHAIFQIYLRGRNKVSGTTATWKHSKFSLIDLAGSEKGNVTTNNKQQREGKNINRSLLALGNVINALAERNKNPKIFIPYRDSKLTRLLKDSLGGSCQTIMIANLSPSSKSYEDTYNTLKYANRAKNIKVELVKNVVQVETHVGEYNKLVADLKEEISVLNEKLQEKNETAEKLKMLEEFDKTHKNFDKKCREVFQERAQLKRELTVLEAEEHSLATQIKQNELYLRVISGVNSESHLLPLVQAEMDTLSENQSSTKTKIATKKSDLVANMERANNVQREIHEYIQQNSANIPKPLGPEILVQLWEFHLVKVQSYFAEHSVSALQEAVVASERQLQHMNDITEEIFNVVSSDENVPDSVRSQLGGLCMKLLESQKKRNGVVWADERTDSDHPTSNLFPSPKLVQPQSPTLSFTPGKTLVGSTPQLNKLQAAHVRGEAFSTPAPSKLQACFNARFSAMEEQSKLNLIERFNTIKKKAHKPILKDRSQTSADKSEDSVKTNSSTESEVDLNSTFTLDEPKVANSAPPKPAPKRKMSMIPAPSHVTKRNALVSPFPKPGTVNTRSSSPGPTGRLPRPTATAPRKMTPRARSAPRLKQDSKPASSSEGRNLGNSQIVRPKVVAARRGLASTTKK